MTALDRKLLRDVWTLKGQAFAISLVIGAGVAMFIMYLSTFHSLRLTQQTYYERYRFADVFAGLTRAEVEANAKTSADLAAAADLCTAIARTTDANDLPAFLTRASGALGASGVVVWMAAGDELIAASAHGYDPRAIEQSTNGIFLIAATFLTLSSSTLINNAGSQHFEL